MSLGGMTSHVHQWSLRELTGSSKKVSHKMRSWRKTCLLKAKVGRNLLIALDHWSDLLLTRAKYVHPCLNAFILEHVEEKLAEGSTSVIFVNIVTALNRPTVNKCITWTSMFACRITFIVLRWHYLEYIISTSMCYCPPILYYQSTLNKNHS